MERHGNTSLRLPCPFKKKEPITAFLICVLSALRLCVWLCDNGYIKIFCLN